MFEKLLERDMDAADVLVGGEGADASEPDFEGEAILLRERFVECEVDGEIPRGVGAAFFVDGGLGLVAVEWVTGDRNDGVYVHLDEEVAVLDVLCGCEVEFQCSVFHCVTLFWWCSRRE